MEDLDLFIVFRSLLFVFLATYALLAFISTVRRLTRVLHGDDPNKRLLRLYLSYQLVSVRVRPLASELLDLAIWASVLFGLWWLHRII